MNINEELKKYSEISLDNTEFATLNPYTILSENLSSEHLNILTDTVVSNIALYDGIIVTHGSDTLQYSASALAYAVGCESVPVVLVSSNFPLEDERANGIYNFIGAVEFINNNEFLDEDNKIYAMNDKTLKVISNELGEEVIANNVNKTYDIYAGMSDVCEGNRWIIASTEDNKFIALSVDSLICGSKIKTIDVSAELAKKKIDDVISIYNTKTFTNQYEPKKYEVYAITENGESTEITSIFE